jgi:hypothetical protein
VTSTNGTAQVCLVDDQPYDAEATLRGSVGGDVVIRARAPSELEPADLEKSDVILVDFELRSGWTRSGDIALLRHPPNGLAIAGVIRAHLLDMKPSRPRAIALYSAELEQVGHQLPPEVRGHALARLHDLEWVFEKKDRDSGRRILELCAAVRALTDDWPDNTEEAERELHRLLSVPVDAAWAGRAKDEIEDCYPPIHELSELSHTLALLRWLAQRVLPYPCFLSDGLSAAARLRLTPAAFDTLAGSTTDLAKELEATHYQGILSEFLGRRWWRAGLDDCLWRWTGGSLSSHDLRAALLQAGLEEPEPLSEPVVVLNNAYQGHGLAEVTDAVRIQPDDWPAFADPAWLRIDEALLSPRLRGLVIRDDRKRLPAAEPPGE